MSDTLHQILLTLALIFVIEGLIYAMFPHMMRKMMQAALECDPARLRMTGLGVAVAGTALIWIIQQLH